MCRLFAFRSVIPSQVHSSLVGADNALLHQSTDHPDGWGVAYYHGGCPHVIKSVQTAVDDRLFQTVSGIVASETVVAHLRKATAGELSILNTHPFQFGKWVFAHNGNIENFAAIRPQLVDQIAPIFRRFLLGKTDSEVLFFLFISNLARSIDVHRNNVKIEDVFQAIKSTIETVCKIAPMHGDIDGKPDHTYLSFIVTNGQTLAAHHGGQTLHYSTHKSKCSQRIACPYLSQSCEAPSQTGYVNHFLVSSEPLQGENIWNPMAYGQIVGTDSQMSLRFDSFDYTPYLHPNLVLTEPPAQSHGE